MGFRVHPYRRGGGVGVAIGGGMGTLSEMALGLKWGKEVFALYRDIALPGAKVAQSVDQLIEWTTAWLLSR